MKHTQLPPAVITQSSQKLMPTIRHMVHFNNISGTKELKINTINRTNSFHIQTAQSIAIMLPMVTRLMSNILVFQIRRTKV